MLIPFVHNFDISDELRKEQERFQELWEEVEREEKFVDKNVELIAEERIVEERNTDSESATVVRQVRGITLPPQKFHAYLFLSVKMEPVEK